MNRKHSPDDVLTFVGRYVAEHGYSPTIREIAKGVGVTSYGGVMSSMKSLREQGLITFVNGQARTVRPTELGEGRAW